MCGRNRTPKTSHAQESRATHAGYKTWIRGGCQNGGIRKKEWEVGTVDGLLGGGFKHVLFSTLIWGDDPIYQFDELILFSLGFFQPPTSLSMSDIFFKLDLQFGVSLYFEKDCFLVYWRCDARS